MTVDELRKALEGVPGDTAVWIYEEGDIEILMDYHGNKISPVMKRKEIKSGMSRKGS